VGSDFKLVFQGALSLNKPKINLCLTLLKGSIMEKERGSKAAIAEIIKIGKKISID